MNIDKLIEDIHNDRELFKEALQDDKLCDSIMGLVRICSDRLSWYREGSDYIAPRSLINQAVSVDWYMMDVANRHHSLRSLDDVDGDDGEEH